MRHIEGTDTFTYQVLRQGSAVAVGPSQTPLCLPVFQWTAPPSGRLVAAKFQQRCRIAEATGICGWNITVHDALKEYIESDTLDQ